MPTGYTDVVADGSVTDLRTFALQLARGMGALVMMRDDPHDAPIPEKFEPRTYNADRLAEAESERDRLSAMSDEDAADAAKVEHREYLAAREEAAADHAARRDRYEGMLAKVEAWKGAPEGIRDFAIEQLERGMEFDCGQPFRFYRDEPPLDGAAWKASKLEKVARDIEYHAVEDAKERVRTSERNAWIAQLRRSLTVGPPPPRKRGPTYERG